MGRLGLVERMFPYLRRRGLLLAQKMPQFKVRKRLMRGFEERMETAELT